MAAAALGIRKKTELAKKLGIGRTTLYYIEAGEIPPNEQFIHGLAQLEQSVPSRPETFVHNLAANVPPEAAGLPRTIPVLGWAHAGEAGNYDEIPESWQVRVPTECRDPKAFAVRLEGDSMEPKFSEGDLLIVQPSEEIYNGCLAVIKLLADGYIFRRIELRSDCIRVIPLNPQWGVEELPKTQIAWAYPVWGMWRQVWRK